MSQLPPDWRTHKSQPNGCSKWELLQIQVFIIIIHLGLDGDYKFKISSPEQENWR